MCPSSEVSVDLLNQIRQGYEADPKYRTASPLPPGVPFDSRLTKDTNTGLLMYLGNRIYVPKGGNAQSCMNYTIPQQEVIPPLNELWLE